MRCELIAGHPDFRALSSIEGIAVELRYATDNNFVGRNLYGDLDCAWVHREAGSALERTVAWLAQNHSGLRLLVLDALRPHRVQIELWDFLEGTELRRIWLTRRGAPSIPLAWRWTSHCWTHSVQSWTWGPHSTP